MSVDLVVIGFASPDKRYKALLNVLNACKEANIDIPEEVDAFFDGDYNPDPIGMDAPLGDALYTEKSYGDTRHTIDISKLPSNITHIKIYME